jgi:hypothetical protein
MAIWGRRPGARSEGRRGAWGLGSVVGTKGCGRTGRRDGSWTMGAEARTRYWACAMETRGRGGARLRDGAYAMETQSRAGAVETRGRGGTGGCHGTRGPTEPGTAMETLGRGCDETWGRGCPIEPGGTTEAWGRRCHEALSRRCHDPPGRGASSEPGTAMKPASATAARGLSGRSHEACEAECGGRRDDDDERWTCHNWPPLGPTQRFGRGRKTGRCRSSGGPRGPQMRASAAFRFG